MTKLQVHAIDPNLSFGATISGVTMASLSDTTTREHINAVFEDRGLIVFKNVEASGEMQLALSDVFGPLKSHPVAAVDLVNNDLMPGVIQIRHDPNTSDSGIVELNGERLVQWLPWHFDHCYNNELNRAGILRAVEIPSAGGLTGFADGIQIYNDFDPALRQQLEDKKVLYTLDMIFDHMRFGRPDALTEVFVAEGVYTALEQAAAQPRAIHPAIWQKPDGTKILHISPWMAVGLVDHENSAGDELLTAACREISQKVRPYFHRWQPNDMLIWDNWRMIHSVTGHNPNEARCMHRTTIKGDYGLGCFENNGIGGKILETTV